MIKINIDCAVLDSQGITVNEVLALIKFKYPRISYVFTPAVTGSLIDKGLVTMSIVPKLTSEGEEVVGAYVLNIDDNISELAQNLREIYPSGKKGNAYYWRGSISEIETKLRAFYKKYGHKYSPEEVEVATKKYVDSFTDLNRDKAMMLLKYFIAKDNTSTLLSYLDHIQEGAQLTIEYGNTKSI